MARLKAFAASLTRLLGLGGAVQQGKHFAGVFLRKTDDRVTLDYTLGFQIGGLHDELIDRRTQKLRGLFERVPHAVRDANRNPFARLFCYMGHVHKVPDWHRLANGVWVARQCR